jgi:molybdopterin-guanine dinucleotide biosynthesis protein A
VVSAGRDAGAARVIVVGPRRAELTGVSFVDDDRRGPVPALSRGLAEVTAPLVAVLAADLPLLRAKHISRIIEKITEAHGAVLVDTDHREQWLAGCWRTDSLRAALAGYAGESLRGLLAPLRPVLVAPEPGEPPPWLDCDTPADVERARGLLS